MKMGLTSPFRYNHHRYMAAAAAAAAAAATAATTPTNGTTAGNHQYPGLTPGFQGFLPNSWFRPDLAQYLNSTRNFLGHPGLTQPYFLSRIQAGSKLGTSRTSLSPPPLSLPPLHYPGALMSSEEKLIKSSSSSITGDQDNSTLSPSHSE